MSDAPTRSPSEKVPWKDVSFNDALIAFLETHFVDGVAAQLSPALEHPDPGAVALIAVARLNAARDVVNTLKSIRRAQEKQAAANENSIPLDEGHGPLRFPKQDPDDA